MASPVEEASTSVVHSTKEAPAGVATPPDMVHSTHTLEDLYNRLSTGAETTGAKRSGTGRTVDDVMAIAPMATKRGAKPKEVACGRRYWGLRADGSWGAQEGKAGCPPPPPAPVSKTGQTRSYAPNDDGATQNGIVWPSPRFANNNNGSITDNLTGLVWLENSDCFSGQTWKDALGSADGLASGSCGLSDGSVAGDWRLPNRRELRSLIDYGQANPALPLAHPFTGIKSRYYWSSSTRPDTTSYAWCVYFNNGYVGYLDKSVKFYVWPVRGGK